MTETNLRLAQEIIEFGILDVDFYRSHFSNPPFSNSAEAAIHYLEHGERQRLAPSGIFDPAYYLQTNPDLGNLERLTEHYVRYGRLEGRSSSLALQLIKEGLDEAAIEDEIIPSPNVLPNSEGYHNAFAKSLRALDDDLRYFSRKYYLTRNPDLESMTLDPLIHYLKYGRHEGRVTNVTLLEGIQVNEALIDPQLPFVLIGVHEASTTGAPIVGMDLAKEMVDDYNVIFVSLRKGALLDQARDLFPVTVSGSHYDEDNYFLVDFIVSQFRIKDAIFSSSACVPFIRPLSSHNCRITCLVHEFLEYMVFARSIIYLCDLLVFSSRELLKSWQYMLDDVQRPAATMMVLPQPASSSNTRSMPKAEARALIASATGIDLSDATLVLGAGEVQIRKGTDIFLQIGNQLAREDGKYAAIWIGKQISELDMGFGVWFHAQIERSRNSEGHLAVHFEPAGPLYPILMDAADVFLVTSRLDPLPNVALDAAARGVPVIAFSGATGLADVAELGEMNLTEVQIGAVDEVILAIRNVTNLDSVIVPSQAKALSYAK